MITFNQHKQYENLIKNGFEKYPNARDLMILGKEWKFKENMTLEEIKNKLISFCQTKYEYFNEAKSLNLIDIVLKRLETVEEYSALPEKLTFFEEEIHKIEELPNKEDQKLLFMILALSKLRCSNGIYINSASVSPMKDIFSLIGVKKTNKQQIVTFRNLFLSNMIEIDLKPILRIRVPFIRQEGNVIFEGEASENIINLFEKYLGTPFFICERCGKETKRNRNVQRYCKECAKKVINENKKILMRKRRLLPNEK